MTDFSSVRQMLHAYGDPVPHQAYPQEPHAETVRTVDSMVTDFIIESCHAAARTASHAGRQKVKAEDFHFALREDPAKLGRVQELFKIERELKEARKQFNENDDRIAGLKDVEKQTHGDEGGKDAAEAAAPGEKQGKAKAKTKAKGKGKGRPKKDKVEKKTGRRG